MPSCNTYHLSWVSLTLDMGYLLTTAPPDLELGVAPLSPPRPRSHRSFEVGLLLSAAAPDLRHGIAPLGPLAPVQPQKDRRDLVTKEQQQRRFQG